MLRGSALWENMTHATSSSACGAHSGERALFFNRPYFRWVTTLPLDVRYGGVITFRMIMGPDAPVREGGYVEILFYDLCMRTRLNWFYCMASNSRSRAPNSASTSGCELVPQPQPRLAATRRARRRTQATFSSNGATQLWMLLQLPLRVSGRGTSGLNTKSRTSRSPTSGTSI